MARLSMYDVIVVGGGPGGAIAAKRCAQHGLKTLLIEKKKLPRDKVCSGMVMGEWAHSIILDEMGEIPDSVLTDPPYLAGHRLYVSGAEPRTLEWETPLTWRKDLDFWLVQGAAKAGVSVEEAAPVAGVTMEDGVCSVIIKKRETMETLRTRYVIGADGGTSIVRRFLFPGMKVRYSAPKRECYRGALDLERDYIHWFFPKGRPRPRYNINHKGDHFLVEGSGIRQLRPEIDKKLAETGFDPATKPEWNDSCSIALLHDQLVSRAFVPAKGNVLLIGDAAGLILPITFEGIGSALKSGLFAADSIIKSTSTREDASDSYLEKLESVREVIGRLYSIQLDLETAADSGPPVLASALEAAYRETLTIQSQ